MAQKEDPTNNNCAAFCVIAKEGQDKLIGNYEPMERDQHLLEVYKNVQSVAEAKIGDGTNGSDLLEDAIIEGGIDPSYKTNLYAPFTGDSNANEN